MNPDRKPTLRAAAESREALFIGDHAHSDLLIFLDFDGVLHPLGPGQTRFSCAPALLSSLTTLSSKGAHPSVALSTTWRFQPMELILSELDLAAPGLSAFVEGRCGRIDPSETPAWIGSRHAEILDYCAMRAHGPAPRMAILDDQASLFGSGHPPASLILCDPTQGFSQDQADRLLSLAASAQHQCKPMRP
jgi:hypothetical protein